MVKTTQQILAEHAAGTLPDSIAQREIILRAILLNLKRAHPAYDNIRRQLAGLEQAAKLQAELPFHFDESSRPVAPRTKSSNGDGDGKGDGK